MSILSEKLEFVAIMQAEYPKSPPHFTMRLCQKLMAHGATANRLAVTMCNHDLTHLEERCQEQLPRRVADTLAEFKLKGIKAKIGGDPRGCTLKLVLPSRRTNDFGQEGICVPGA